MNRPITILCITGWCRSGSTIIGNILGQVPGFFHVGELHFLWQNAVGRGSNNLCGCGTELALCPVWSQILTVGQQAGVSAEAFADAVVRRQHACVRTRHTWRVLRRGLCGADIREHAALMASVYRAIAERTAARVIVDTTKIPGEAALLPGLDGVAPYYVHLVRDPRAVAQSWSQQKQYAYVMPSWKSTAYWHGFNLASQAITRRYPDRSLFLRYEDFIARPADVVAALLRLCGTEASLNPVRGGAVELRTNHTVTGNPDRFRSGRTVIRGRDDSWRTGLNGHAKLSAVTLSWPLLRRYGYSRDHTFGSGPVRAGAAPQPAGDR